MTQLGMLGNIEIIQDRPCSYYTEGKILYPETF